MTERTFRVILPDGKKTKPYTRSHIIAAHDRDAIPSEAKIAMGDTLITVADFCREQLRADKRTLSEARKPWHLSTTLLGMWGLLVLIGSPFAILAGMQNDIGWLAAAGVAGISAGLVMFVLAHAIDDVITMLHDIRCSND